MSDGRNLLGAGMAAKAANLTALRKIYDREAIEVMSAGQEMPPFEIWVDQYQADNADASMKEGFNKVRKMTSRREQ